MINEKKAQYKKVEIDRWKVQIKLSRQENSIILTRILRKTNNTNLTPPHEIMKYFKPNCAINQSIFINMKTLFYSPTFTWMINLPPSINTGVFALYILYVKLSPSLAQTLRFHSKIIEYGVWPPNFFSLFVYIISLYNNLLSCATRWQSR